MEIGDKHWINHDDGWFIFWKWCFPIATLNNQMVLVDYFPILKLHWTASLDVFHCRTSRKIISNNIKYGDDILTVLIHRLSSIPMLNYWIIRKAWFTFFYAIRSLKHSHGRWVFMNIIPFTLQWNMKKCHHLIYSGMMFQWFSYDVSIMFL